MEVHEYVCSSFNAGSTFKGFAAAAESFKIKKKKHTRIRFPEIICEKCESKEFSSQDEVYRRIFFLPDLDC